jgi:hypothetical protein
MRLLISGLVAASLCIDSAAFAADVDLAKGRLTHTGSYSSQTVAATNNTGTIVQAIKIECGFFRQGALLAAGMGIAQNVQPRQTAYVEVIANHAEGADNADCRVGLVQ